VLDHTGIATIANAIPDMRVLAKLDISGNHIEQGEALEPIIAICSAKSIELTAGAGFGE
jgi:hypothetical protein